MRRRGLWAALALAATCNAWVLVRAAFNRLGAPEAEIELTERELPLVSFGRESTALLLRLKWDGRLDQQKLEELGFDCRVAVNSPEAERYYQRFLPVSAWVVFDSRLVAMDAGRDRARLRAKYADRSRFVISRATVRPRLERGWDSTAGQYAYLRGLVAQVFPAEVHVPRPYREVLEPLRAKGTSGGGQPRYAVTLRYGSGDEPWVTGCRLLY